MIGGSTISPRTSCPSVPERLADQCLCEAEIPSFLQANTIGILASTIAGEIGATNALKALVCGRWFKSMMGVCLTLSLRSKVPRPQKPAATQKTASRSVTLYMFAHTRAKSDSCSLTVCAWVEGYPPPARHSVRRRGAGLAAALAQTWDLDGQPVAFLEVVPARGSASTLLEISKAVRSLYLSHYRVPQTDGSLVAQVVAVWCP
jgi:hypothetical protein